MTFKKRTYNTRLIRMGLSYSVQEVAGLFGLHKNSVLQWIKSGLPVIDQRKPYLIHGADLAAFIKKRQSGRKHKCQPHEFYCCKCRTSRKAWENQVDIVIKNKSKLVITAICAVCNTALHRAGAVRKLAEYQKIFSVQTLREQHITDRNQPIVMCDTQRRMEP